MEAQTIGVLIAFGAGLLSFLSLCVLPLIPSYVRYRPVAGQRAACSPNGAGAWPILGSIMVVTNHFTMLAAWLTMLTPEFLLERT